MKEDVLIYIMEKSRDSTVYQSGSKLRRVQSIKNVCVCVCVCVCKVTLKGLLQELYCAMLSHSVMSNSL